MIHIKISNEFISSQDKPDEEEATEGEGDNNGFLLGLLKHPVHPDPLGFIFFQAPLIFFLQAKVWLNTKQIIAKVKRVFLNMSKQ